MFSIKVKAFLIAIVSLIFFSTIVYATDLGKITISSDKGDPAILYPNDTWHLWTTYEGGGEPRCSCWDFDDDGLISGCVGKGKWFFDDWAQLCLNSFKPNVESDSWVDPTKPWDYTFLMDTSKPNKSTAWAYAWITKWFWPEAGWAYDGIDYKIIRDDDRDGSEHDIDCDDSDNQVYPGAKEICDGKDNNCDKRIDEGCLCIPLINKGPVAEKIDFVFVPDETYEITLPNGSIDNQKLNTFKNDIQYLINYGIFNIFPTNQPVNKEKFNFYYTIKNGSTDYAYWNFPEGMERECRFADVKAIIHTDLFRDSANIYDGVMSSVSWSEGVFVHEASHATYALADTYCGPTYYFQSSVYPNLWRNETSCKDDKATEGYKATCEQVTGDMCSIDWWRLQGSDIMTSSRLSDGYTEAGLKRVGWTLSCAYPASCSDPIPDICKKHEYPENHCNWNIATTAPNAPVAVAQLSLGISGNLLSLRGVNIEKDYFSELTLHGSGFPIKLLSKDRRLLTQVEITDPRIIVSQSEGSLFLDNIEFNLDIPLLVEMRFIEIYGKNNNLLLSIDLYSKIKEYCNNYPTDPNCKEDYPEPPTYGVKPTQTTSKTFTVYNPVNFSTTFTFSVGGIPSSWVSFAPSSLSLGPYSSGSFMISITPPYCTEEKTYDYTVTASSSSRTYTFSSSITVVPIYFDGKIEEFEIATYNGKGIITDKDMWGQITLTNKETFSVPYTKIHLNDNYFTSLSNPTTTGSIPPGDTTLPRYQVFKDPRLKISQSWVTSHDQNESRFYWNETVDFIVDIDNLSPDLLRDASITIPIPDFEERAKLIDVEVFSDTLIYNQDEKALTWSGAINPNEKFSFHYRLVFQPVDPYFVIDKFLEFDSIAKGKYIVDKTLSGITFDKISCVELQDRTYVSYADLKMVDPIDIEVLTRLILAFVTDEENSQFIDRLQASRDDMYFKKVFSKEEFLNELRNTFQIIAPIDPIENGMTKHFYNVFYFANTNYSSNFNQTEMDEIKGLIYNGSLIGRELLTSGYSLKFVPEFKEILGVDYRGSLPMSERFEIRPVTIIKDHFITRGFFNQTLNSTSWLIRTVIDVAEPLAYVGDILPGEHFGKPNWQKEILPGISHSIYGDGKGVSLAADIGTTVFRNMSANEWTQITLNAIDWVVVGVVPEEDLERRDLLINKVAEPKSVKLKKGEGTDTKHVLVKLYIKNIGEKDLFNLSLKEIIPSEITYQKDSPDGNLGNLKSGESTKIFYSILVPAAEEANFNLKTVIDGVDIDSISKTFSKTITIQVEPPEGKEKEPPGKEKEKDKGPPEDKGKGKEDKGGGKGKDK